MNKKQPSGEILNLHKPLGFTPRQTIERYRQLHPEYKTVKMGYAGRLDPMAEGVLVVLVGTATKRMRELMEQDKEYIAQILFGFSTDSQDLLGLAEAAKAKTRLTKTALELQVRGLQGKLRLTLPIYSAYRLKGKPMFYWARRGKSEQMAKPEQDVSVYKIVLESLREIGTSDLL